MNQHNKELYYLKDVKQTTCFPDEAPFKEKETPEYGLKVVKAIESDWFGGIDCDFLQRRNEFRELHLYARGEQPINKYKEVLCFEDGKTKWSKLDWSILKVIPKFVDIVVAGVQERLYTMKAEAIDANASKKRSQERRRIKKEMDSKPFMEDMKNLFGIDTFGMETDKIPLDDDELNVYMETEFKLPIEVSIEKTLKRILVYNDLDIISEQVIRDLVVLGLGGMKHHIEPLSGIKLKYIDPEYLLHSFCKDPAFKDCYYFGEVETISVAELKRMYVKHNIDWDKVRTQSHAFNLHLQISGLEQIKEMDNYPVNILRFAYKTSKEIIYKKKIRKGGNFKMIRRDERYNPPTKEMGRQQRVDTQIDTWMEGAFILGTDILLEWREQSNVVYPSGLLHNPEPNFIMFGIKPENGRYDSLVGRQKTFADEIQKQHMKIQHLVSKINPDGVYFDADALQGIDLGDGGAYTPKEALRLYMETGSVIGRSIREDGNYQNAKPVQPNYTSGQSDKIRNLMNLMNFYMGEMVQSIGANRQATNPDADALVGVQKLAALNSNEATKHIRTAILFILRKTGQGVMTRIKDAWKYAEQKKFLTNGIGKIEEETLQSLSQLNIHDLSVFIELKPDHEERLMLMNDVSEAIKAGLIEIPDKIDILNTDNTKEASMILKSRIKRNKLKKQQEEMAKIKANEESQINIANQANQGKEQVELMKHKNKIEEINAQWQGEIAKDNNLSIIKENLMEKEYNYQLKINAMTESGKLQRESEKEDRKDKREQDKDSRQSEMSHQRKNNLPPIDFESKFDGVEGIEI